MLSTALDNETTQNMINNDINIGNELFDNVANALFTY